MSDAIITVENLSKKYLVVHNTERYTALRDVIGRAVRNLARNTVDAVRGCQVVGGDEVEEFWALRDVSFEVERGDILGIIGRNGAGKSTLLKVLSRITEPTEGRVTLRGRVASLLEVGTGFHPELTGRENIYLNGAILGMTRAEIKRKFDEIVGFAEVEKFLDTPVKRYSSGMYVRLAFAIAAHLEPEILIVDEVLAVGDAEFQKKCLGKIQDISQGEDRTILFVSHNLSSVASLCNRGILLAAGSKITDSSAAEAINSYVLQASRDFSQQYIIFRRHSLDESAPIEILRVELLNADFSPKTLLSSGDALVFRVWVRSRRATPEASVILSIGTPAGMTLAKFETNPGRVSLSRSAGEERIDCRIDSLPLMPGQYLVSVGLAYHSKRLIEWHSDVGTLFVSGNSYSGTKMSDYPEGPLFINNDWTAAGGHSIDEGATSDGAAGVRV
jgi:lipopolysaccharide transport system ATP-binding protein